MCGWCAWKFTLSLPKAESSPRSLPKREFGGQNAGPVCGMGRPVAVLLALAFRVGYCRPVSQTHADALVAGASLNASAAGRRPHPMILLSKGRGGSTVVAEVISRFAHTDEHMIRKEILGHGREDMLHPSDPKATMVDWFAKKGAQHPRSQLIGFKWKPWHIGARAYAGAWDWVVSHDVKVLWMTRNALDEMISSTKHQDAQRLLADGLTPHCKTKDADCIAEHQQTRVKFDPGTLVQMLANDTQMFITEVESLLVAKHVRYHHVTFDDLFESSTERARYHRTSSDDPYESTTNLREHRRFDHARALVAWNQVFAFLGLDAVDEYSKIIKTADSFSARTAPQTQCDSLENPEEVRAALKGSAFEELLTC